MKPFAISLVTVVLAAGCATVPRDSGVADVQREIALRTNQNVEIRRAAPGTDDPRIQALMQGELDADKAVAIALMNNPRVQVALADLGIARADLLEASTIRNPIFGAEMRFPAAPSRPYELSITQSLIDLIQLPRRRAAGRLAFEAATFRVSSEVFAIAADVRAGFYELLAATQHLAMDRATVESARAAAEIAQRQHDAGNITDLDLENQQAMYEQAKLDLARSEEESLLRRETLIRAMGLRSAAVDWKIPENFPAAPQAEATDHGVQQMLAARRLDIAAAQREVEALRRLLPAARVSAIGDIDVDVHRQHDPDGTTSTGPGIDVPIPIFNRGAAARARAEAKLLRAEQQLASLTASASSEARSARQALLAARSRVEYYREVVLPRRKRIVDLTQLEHNAMLVGIFQLLQAKQNELDARRDSIDAQRDYWVARTNFERALSGVDSGEGRGFMPATTQSQGKPAERGGGH
jgi:cobalt-zinc-cadmium efflux system outer membrane protein